MKMYHYFLHKSNKFRSENAIPYMWCPACGKQELAQDDFHCTKCGEYGRWFICTNCGFLEEEWPEYRC